MVSHQYSKSSSIFVIESALIIYNLHDAVKDGIRKRSEDAIAAGNESAMVNVYTTNSPKPLGEISTMAMQTRYYSYKNRNFKEDLIYFTTVETNYKDVARGPNASSIAMGVYEGALVLSGRATGPIGVGISLFNDALSAFNALKTACNCTPLEGQYQDNLQMNVRYDINKKYTYLESGGQYLLGAVTERAYIHWVKTYVYMMVNSLGSSLESVKYVFTTYQTPNDANAAEKALYWAGDPWTEYADMKVPGSNYTINF